MFDRFLAFYKAAQQDRRDGYGPELFTGLAPGELVEARRLLLARALQGETIDLQALAHVGDAEVIETLRHAQASDERLGYTFSVGRLETLFRLTGDPACLDGLFAWVDSEDPRARRFAAQAFSRHTLPRQFAAHFVQRLTSRRYQDVALPLVTGWLATQGIQTEDITTFNRYLPFIRSVMAAPPSRRRSLLANWMNNETDSR
ncbi:MULTISPECIES: hypothetical protein [unclassified Achromobacter]|uniref:hypothetical protein n=1 Tax=unclassified Achromobacter TaxID=2626865 RepID=UPI000B51BD75|nr:MULTISPECIES: hypothetical protein [unclassified Achromobacter]OWT79930.1 hypothetical protein CEY05_00420 [Achromobacter sp. HZ34]OWT81814.1 hypothetical protein CEY04_00420 [Achromobacter sp. HZ28]